MYWDSARSDLEKTSDAVVITSCHNGHGPSLDIIMMLRSSGQYKYIPLKLYRPIVETISDQNTLLSLLLASCHLSTEAEHILYCNIEWGDVVSQTLFF
jgi:hypothetical protein